MSLISTAARLENTVGFVENMRSRINMFIPKSIDVELRQTTDRLLGPVFLEQPDVDGEFPTNRDRWGAQELRKREDKEGFTRKGFFGQLLACGWHHKSAEELRTLGDKVGRHRILIAHGTNDRVISPPHCHVLINELAGEGLSHRIFEGEGHVIPVEKRQEFNDMIEMHVEQSHRSEENGSAAPK
jgi:pimeloyl-ACP methyl ester carboxylesterase